MGVRNWLRDKWNPILAEDESNFEEEEAIVEAKLAEQYASSAASILNSAFSSLEDDDEEIESEEIESDIASIIDVGVVDVDDLLDEDAKLENFSDVSIGEFKPENVHLEDSDSHFVDASVIGVDDDDFIVEIVQESISNDDFEIIHSSPDLDYSSMKVSDLKGLCRKRGLPVGGKKSDIISRLQA